MSENTTETLVTVPLPIDFIYVDPDFNARKMKQLFDKDGTEIKDEEGDLAYEYEGVKDLAKQIKSAGRLLSPILVQEIPEEERAGIQEEEENTLLQYRLIAGFRRTAAMRLLGEDTISSVVFKGDEKEAYFANLAENIQRKDLTSYEKAMRFVELQDDLEISGREIARRLGEGSGHVNNLIRIMKEGNPRILDLFKANHGKATTDALCKHVIKKGADHDEQWALWMKHCGEVDEDGLEDEDGRGGNEESSEPAAKRPSMKHLEAAIGALKQAKADGVDESYLKGVKAGLRWAAAKVKTVPHVYNPAKPPAEDEEE